ncbi:MAG: RNA 2',3'-cyclic phosphodiesterase [Candidatus Eisenbacteria bacterium]|uniref:RNA 2',3'-cyclic phosphodiesterase n=1 Tax=Eiseniibacteriota bacterium TaxID=2212470 RepID=A0A948RTY2_UNCEI|nr:RNA 2',3'-cyclic phosphodiesterase [Candidatus Eisenbacteria bacterium]MBU1950647.1 RNA 2',3'-cyclic phosphodiesterase [Candidatus Eisenbacteria bacterium]MBU2689654.1 RNA 2',3'-cyclic phosphodiesterase [Candidatus Eisenbacteria bacterium]
MEDKGERITRCFLALTFSKEDLAYPTALSSQMMEKLGRGCVKWVAPENLHLTIYFFGGLNKGRLMQARRAIERLAGAWDAVPVSWGGLGAFPSSRKAQVIWVGLNDLENRLTPLIDDTQARLRDFGFGPPDKPFRAHLTLGRVRRGEKLDGAALEGSQGGLTPAPGPFMIRSMQLFRSILRPQGPLYTTLVEAPSRGNEPPDEGE